MGTKKIVHVITGLDLAGAETILYKLLASSDDSIFTSEVISLTDIGEVGRKIQALGVPVRSLGMHRGLPPNPLKLLRLVVWLRKGNPDIIQTWMYHADLIGGIAAQLAGGIPVTWGVHHFNLEPKHNKRSTILTARLCAMLSRWLPTKIVCCSDAACKAHIELGYVAEKIVVIPNGIDISIFKPDISARKNIRNELGLAQNTPLIGMIARIDSQKDHENFVEAAGLLHAEYPDVHYLLCGSGVTWDNHTLLNWIKVAGTQECFHLLGIRQDIEIVTAALTIATLSSFGESFSLMLGEAMACRIPCVTTDIPAAVDLLGGTGWVVPIHDSRSLSNVWKTILMSSEDDIASRLDAARSRIHGDFSLESMVEKYRRLFEGECKCAKS